ncbi:multiple C2 and transmembrane domain-containing protein 1-like [Paramacrobiotus metropolitanus]|uniref:multiple C2 and transmembrane domain-containing protein 1-like n=1 Tax=Paramacrobiotus metropolitanus TaxID=2943436 RepID=UPI0024462447|nr:multiple C2 and transmembrane domain-containing protein 1-like [Paramacrobiotus metropolitanus]
MSSVIPSLTIFLFEGAEFSSEDISNPFCDFALGSEEHRTSAGRMLNMGYPVWMEEFDLFLHDASWKNLQISVWSSHIAGAKRAVLGTAQISIAHLQVGKPEDIWLDMENDGELCGCLHVSVLIGKRCLTVDRLGDPIIGQRRLSFLEKFHIRNTMTLSRNDNVGVLIIKVFKATGLSEDIQKNKQGVFCSVRIMDTHLETPVSVLSLEPEWNCVFTFPVMDVHSFLDVSILRVNGKGRRQWNLLGKTFMRLTDIENGRAKWHILKDLSENVKDRGAVFLEMELIYNPVKAGLRTLRPRETWTEEPVSALSGKAFATNIHRAKTAVAPFTDFMLFVRKLLDWESPPLTMAAFILYMTFVWYCELWMIPFGFLVCILANQRVNNKRPISPLIVNPNIEDREGDKEDQIEERLRNGAEPDAGFFHKVFVEIPDGVLAVQNGLQFTMDLYERACNILLFNEQWLSSFSCVLLFLGTVVLYFVPLRTIFLVYGLHKFTKKLRKPFTIGHNDLLSVLSRARTNAELKTLADLETVSHVRNVTDAASYAGTGSDEESASSSTAAKTTSRPGASAHNIVGVNKILKF